MLSTRYTSAATRRRGVILIVVLAMLTLFAIVGISFVMVAQAQETSSRIAREAESEIKPDIDPEAAFAYAMGQLLYGCLDDSVGITSGVRGHDLCGGIYGWNLTPASNPPPVFHLNDKPFSGPGRLQSLNPAIADPTRLNWNNEAFLMNFQHFPADGFLRDPGRLPRANPTVAQNQYLGGSNVPYTYPDHNNFYLAEIDPNTGRIVTPSFHREYLFGALNSPTSGPMANANWTNRIGKYLTVRPRPQEHPNFPYPVDRFGDVKNLDGAPGGADSIWIDIGAPVMTTKDGRKYKMLVAPLILALDGRLDLNAVGNILGVNGGTRESRSHQGWGVWEVNPAHVLNVDVIEWQRLFQGSAPAGQARIPGRYDNIPARNPIGLPLGGGNRVRAWAQVDYNALTETGAGQSTPLTLPNSYFAFPDFPGTCFANGGAAENTNHPSISYLFGPAAPNRRLPVRDLAQLLRFGGTNTDMMPTDTMRLLRQNLVRGATDASGTTNAAAAMKRRNLVTLLSADLDRPGATPYIWDPSGTPGDPAADPALRLQLQLAADGQPTLAGNRPIPFPQLTSRGATPVGEFDPITWRSLSAAIGRIDLNRTLTAFPAADPATGIINLAGANGTAMSQAFADRIRLAQELYTALRAVTGGMDPTAAYGIAPVGNSPEFRALRYLAQLAVNIVDYIDNDDFNTTFEWFTLQTATPVVRDFVYGVEQPRLVVNETYVQYDNDDRMLAPVTNAVTNGSKYNVNVWVELFNPMPDDAPPGGPRTDTTARLNYGGVPANGNHIYRILLCDEDINNPNPANAATYVLRHPANTAGDPNFGGTNRTRSIMNYWGPDMGAGATPQSVFPMPAANRFNGSATTGTGFWVIGPQVNYQTAGHNPGLTTTYLSQQMTYGIDSHVNGNPDPAANLKRRPTVLLQRLTVPGLPFQNDPTMPLYNPYITVDVVEHAPTHVVDARTHDTGGPRGGPNAPPAMTARRSFGRPQPLAGASAWRLSQQPNPAIAMQPQTTFFRQNSATSDPTMVTNTDTTLKVPFDWMTHLDRQPINAVELLHVAHCKPSELTTVFARNDATNFNFRTAPVNQQIAPWTDETARLYRFLEFVQTGPLRTWGQNPTRLGRVPGKVNINGIWNAEVFRALADRQNGNGFIPGQVETIMANMIASRSPGSAYLAPNTTISLRPTDLDLAVLAQNAGFVPDATVHKPFWSLSLGGTGPMLPPNGALGTGARGIDNTILRRYTDPTTMTTAPLFDVPLQTHPYRQKELLTKIYNSITTRSNVFGVWVTVGYFEVDSAGRLGAELGKSENRNVRHRMFSIVDRTQMAAFEVTTTQMAAAGPITLTNILPGATTAVTDNRTGRTWNIAAGTVLTFSPNTALEENVVVQGGGTLTLAYTHPAGSTVICRGNPGPWTRYDPRKDTNVVPYFAVID